MEIHVEREDFLKAAEVQSLPEPKIISKMQEAAEHIEGVLLPLFPELDDSGIDSDSTELLASSARELQERHGIMSDGSSDEDHLARPWWDAMKPKEDDQYKAMEDGTIYPLDVNWPLGQHQPFHNFEEYDIDPDRASTPLYEVELTASDEDDDGSVLELVIPMQTSRYKRVPTASPKKAKPKPKAKVNRTFYYSFICCMRK